MPPAAAAAAAPGAPLDAVLGAGAQPGGNRGALDALLGRLGIDFSNISGPLNTPVPTQANRPSFLNTSGGGSGSAPSSYPPTPGLAQPPRGPSAEPEEERRRIQFGLGGTIISDSANPNIGSSPSGSGSPLISAPVEPQQKDFKNYSDFRGAQINFRARSGRLPPPIPTADEFFNGTQRAPVEPQQKDFKNYSDSRGAQINFRAQNGRRPPPPPSAAEFFR